MKGYDDLVKLLKTTQATGGLDVSESAICEYQDMIGHSGEDQLEELANGIYKETFYRVYGYAYGTVAAIQFHCQHGKKIIEMMEKNADLSAEVDRLNFLLGQERDAKKKAIDDAAEQKKQAEDLDADLHSAQYQIEKKDKEIIELKARLYDLMTK